MSRSPIAVAPVQLNLGDSSPAQASQQITFREIVTAAREHALRIVLTSLAMGLLAASLAAVLPRYYESSTRIFIDPRGLQIVEKDVNPRSGSGEQAVSLVESEMRILYSDNVLRSVVERQGLAADAEFNGDSSTFSRLVEKGRAVAKSIIGVTEEPTPPDLAALRYLQRAIKVRREPQSYVIDLSVTTKDPGKSQMIADRIAEEYVQTRFASLSAATRKGIDAMSGRLDELRKAVVTAEENVEKFKRQNNIVGASGRLVNEQQLAELNSQLVVARNEAAKAGDLLDQINRLKKLGVEPDAMPEALRSETMTRLRTQFAAIRRREAFLSATLLPTHPNMRQVQRELSDTRRLISDELARFAENVRLEAERARANEKTLEKSFEGLKSQASSTNEKGVRLRELEREADANRSIYSSFLNRSRELKEQVGIDTAMASVLSPAIPPRGPKAPTLLHLLAGGSLLGFALALNSALQRHRSDPRLRSERQLRSITGASRPLVVPKLTEAVRLQHGWLGASSAKVTSVPTFALTNPDAPASIALARLTAELDARSGGQKPLIVLVTAIGDLEGKSTVAVNAALAAARAGDKVLLIDADARNRGVSRLLPGGEALPGLFDIASGAVQPGQAIVKSRSYPLDILPAGQATDARHPRLQDPIAELAKPYDLVVIDGGVLIRDRHVAEFAGGASQVVLVARDGVTLRADYQSAFEILDRSGRVRPVLLTDK